jgi:hypothetical protein
MTPPTPQDTSTPRDAGPLGGARAPTLITVATPRYFESELRLLPGVILPLRSMLVPTANEDVLISPVGSIEEYAAVGRTLVTLVAPNIRHHRFLLEAWKRLHVTTVWGPPGFTETMPEIADIHILGADTWPFRDVLDFVVLQGAPKQNEVVFFHRPSRTLYTADLVLAISASKGVLAPLALRALGVHERFAMMRPWRRWVTDRAAFQRSIRRVLDWDFTRIAMAHGDVVEADARQKLTAALRERGLFA